MFKPKPLGPHKKRLVLKFGVIGFVALILVFYVLNLKNTFQIKTQTSRPEESFDWNKIKNDFDVTMTQVSQRFNEERSKQIAQASAPLINKLVNNINTPNTPNIPNTLTVASSSDQLSASNSQATLNRLELKLDLNTNKPKK
ncbi:MAG: hypothetical protein NTX66_02340 [Candidatus Falkowbacteria bacterium]|nr:hypothetical protein [Candidatus Falkowbacteria bacterium]